MRSLGVAVRDPQRLRPTTPDTRQRDARRPLAVPALEHPPTVLLEHRTPHVLLDDFLPDVPARRSVRFRALLVFFSSQDESDGRTGWCTPKEVFAARLLGRSDFASASSARIADCAHTQSRVLYHGLYNNPPDFVIARENLIFASACGHRVSRAMCLITHSDAAVRRRAMRVLNNEDTTAHYNVVYATTQSLRGPHASSDADMRMYARMYAQYGGGNCPITELALGRMHLERQQYAEAFQLIHKAATTGICGAFYELGLLYDEGRGVPKCPTTALCLFTKSARGGFPPGMYQAGRMLFADTAVQTDDSAAFGFFSSAVKGSNYYSPRFSNPCRSFLEPVPEAHHFLGLCYMSGRGCARDVSAAIREFQNDIQLCHELSSSESDAQTRSVDSASMLSALYHKMAGENNAKTAVYYSALARRGRKHDALV